MSKLPRGLEEILSDIIYLRSNKEDVVKSIKELDIIPSEEFIEFYKGKICFNFFIFCVQLI